jgi:drug/metabolite transporter (DMT)-like permease
VVVWGIVAYVCQQIAFAGETAMVHAIGLSLSTWQIIVLRGIGVLALSFCLGSGLRAALKTDQAPLMVLRWLTSMGYMGVFAFSYTHLPLTDATAISYAQTLYMTLFADLFLGEKASLTKWLIVLTGFCGALVVAHPTGGANTLIYIAVLVGTSLNALTVVLGRLLQRRDNATTVMFWPSLATILIFAPFTINESWQPSWLWIGLLVLGPVGVAAGVYAVRYADIAVLAPWLYSRLIIAAFIGIVLMKEIPDQWTVVGLVLIMLSCVMTFFMGDKDARPIRVTH